MSNIYFVGKLLPDLGMPPSIDMVETVKALLIEEPDNFIGHSLLIEEALFDPPSMPFRGNICLCLDEMSAQISHIFAYDQGQCVFEHALDEPMECPSELIAFIEISLSADGEKKCLKINPDQRLFYKPAIEKIQSLCEQNFEADTPGYENYWISYKSTPIPKLPGKTVMTLMPSQSGA